jgi:hypothetical protein
MTSAAEQNDRGMTRTAMTRSGEPVSIHDLRRTARSAGWVYLVLFVSGIVAEFFVRSALFVPGDAVATAANIAATPGALRWGIVADLVMIISDILLAFLFYRLLKEVDRFLAALSVAFRFAQAVILGANLLNLYIVVAILGDDRYLSAIPGDQINALALFFAELHGTGYALALLFFAVSLFIVGYLVIRSHRFPTILGVMLIVASLGYAADTLARTLLLSYDRVAHIFDTAVIVPAFIGELAMVVYLIVRGIRRTPADAESNAAA